MKVHCAITFRETEEMLSGAAQCKMFSRFRVYIFVEDDHLLGHLCSLSPECYSEK